MEVLPLAALLLIIPSMVEGMKVKVLPLAVLLLNIIDGRNVHGGASISNASPHHH